MKNLLIVMVIIILVILAIFFYAGFYYPIEEAPRLVDQVDEEPITKVKDRQIAPLEDVVIFSFQRNHPNDMQKFVLEHKGMENLELLENNLKRQDYIAILTALWSEQNPEKRLIWLREKQLDSHPILIFELAVEVMKQAPTVENFEEALFLLELGKYRTDLDAACITDTSASAAAQSLYTTYAKAIANEVGQHPALIKELIKTPQNELSEEVLEKLLTALMRTKYDLQNLPPPDWVSGHALQKLFVDKDIVLTPLNCVEKRKKMIDYYIEEVEHQLQRLAPVNPIKIKK